MFMKYWSQQKSVVKKGRYFGEFFKPGRGVTQGDIISPILFNILIDSVVRKVERQIDENEFINLRTFSIFYADDGAISGTCSSKVQQITTDLDEFFEKFGLFFPCILC